MLRAPEKVNSLYNAHEKKVSVKKYSVVLTTNAKFIALMNIRISRLQTTLVSTRYKTPSVASGLQARRGFEGVYLASGRPTRRRGRAGARDGGGGVSG